MSGLITRVRMFAGPNGSGKSTLLREILPETLQGVYLNPDEIEKRIRQQGYLDLGAHGVRHGGEAIAGFFRDSSFLRTVGLGAAVARLRYDAGRL